MMEINSLKDINVTDRDKLLYYKTIIQNPYVHLKPYPRQAIPVILAGKQEHEGKVNSVLSGGAAYGGKTIVGSILAVQYLQEPDYTCLVTRKNYAELLDTNSIWENLIEWCCNEKLSKDLRCEYYKTPVPKIVSPNGNTIYFKAFDREDKKQKFKSASYDRIVNDEASELPEGILPFQYRSMRNTSKIPRSIINLSNPGGESTEYLVDEFIHGNKPYISLGWNHNPHIDKEAYKATLEELDYVDQRYQMIGDWTYKPSIGDLINRDEAESQYITNNTVPYVYNLMAIDLAGKGRDMFAIVSYDYLSNGWEYVDDFAQTKSADPEGMLIDFIIRHNPLPNQPKTSIIVIEQEGGGSPEYARKYFQNMILESGYNIPVVLKKPSGSKYQRARPLIHSIKYGNVKLNQDGEYMSDFIDEMVQLDPSGKGRSPNLVDSASLARNYLSEVVLGNKTSFKTGKRIGGTIK